MRETVTSLVGFAGRGPCTDGERRAAVWLRERVRAGGRDARLQTVWVRPGWPAAHALHAAAATIGSLVAVRYPLAAVVVLGLTLVSMAVELSGRGLVARLAFARRATQDLVSDDPREAPVRLVVTAAIDAGRTGAVLRPGYARVETALRRALRGHFPSPLAVLLAAVALLLGLAIVRLAGTDEPWVGAAAVAPTVALIIAFGALVDIALSPPSPGANAHASAAAVALALVAELDRRPPRHLAVDLVLTGAGEGGQAGMRAYVRSRRRLRRPEEVAVLALGPCGAGRPRFHVTEGLLLPLRMHPRLVAHARDAAAGEAHLGASALRRGFTGAHAARLSRWPALAISCTDERDLHPRARTPEDAPDAIEPAAMDAALELCLAIVARLDADLARAPAS